MTDEVERPAMLKVLLGAINVTVFSAISSDSDATGVCVNPGSIRSQCISSEIITIFCFRQISARRVSSSGVQTLPTGLWGFDIIIIFVLLSIPLARESKSIDQVPSDSVNLL